MGYVRYYKPGDAFYIAPRMREADRQEVLAASGQSPFGALVHGAQVTKTLYTVVDDRGYPCAMFGVVPGNNGHGSVWLLGTDALTRGKMRKQFVHHSEDWLSNLQSQYSVLSNVIDERNTVHIDWLKRMGFQFTHRFERYGYEGRPFLYFERRSIDV